MPKSKPRKPIADLIEELKSWIPNYDHGPNEFPTVLYRILASAPGGDELEDIGYEPFNLGWQELDMLGRTLVAIQDKRDVEDIVAGLIHDGEEGEVDEARRRRPMARAPARRAGRGMPTENIFWRSIPAGSRVELVGHSYVVTLPDGRRARARTGAATTRLAAQQLPGQPGAPRHQAGTVSSRSTPESEETLMATFQRRHYVEVARILHGVRDHHERQRLAEEFARMFRQDNPQFDAERFSSAVFGEGGGRRVRESRRSYSMTYGTMPPYEKFVEDIRRSDPDEPNGEPFWPEGTLYPMELVTNEEIALAEDYGGLTPFTPSRYAHKSGFRGDEQAIYGFLQYLVDAFNDGNDEAGDLASSIMTTLGYEWI